MHGEQPISVLPMADVANPFEWGVPSVLAATREMIYSGTLGAASSQIPPLLA